MKQKGFAFKALCYNFPMSEKKQAVYSELSHPHAGDPRVDPKAKANRPVVTRRAPLKTPSDEAIMGTGFFPSLEPTVLEPTPTVAPKPETVLRERALLFNEGMPMYRVSYRSENDEPIIPRTWEQAEELFLGRLPVSAELKIDKSCLEKGKKEGTVIKRVGKSYFGAFTIALYPTVDEDGKDTDIPILADMRQRSREQNIVEKFRRETSSLHYYAALPRNTARRKL